MSYIFVVFVIGGIASGNLWAQAASPVFATIYAIALGPGAFTGGSEVDRRKLQLQISEKWSDAERIAEFISRYWFSMKFVRSARRRGANCSFISLTSLALTGWYFYTGMPIWFVVWHAVNGISLWAIGNRVNKAFFILYHRQGTAQWDIACISFFVLSDVLNNEDYKFIINNNLPQDQVESAIVKYEKRRPPGSLEDLDGHFSWGFRVVVFPNHNANDLSPSVYYHEIGEGSPEVMLGYSRKYGSHMLAFTNTTWNWEKAESRNGMKAVRTFLLKFNDLKSFNGAPPEQLEAFFEELEINMVAEGDAIYTKIRNEKAMSRFFGSLSCGKSLTLSDRDHNVLATYSLDGAGDACVMWSMAIEAATQP